MATPGWVRRHHRIKHTLRTIALLELARQADDRIEIDTDPEPEWTPRRGMTFGSDQT